MPEGLTNAKTIFGAVLNTPFDVFKMYGYAVDQAKANYESIKSGITKIAADAYLTNVNGISIPKEALIVTDLEKNMIAQIWDYLAPIGYTAMLIGAPYIKARVHNLECFRSCPCFLSIP